MNRILKTHQISAEVIELIGSTERQCYLVTPYLRSWPLLNRSLDKAKDQEKQVTVFVRSGEQGKNGIPELQRRYQFELFAVENLHTKLYLNERTAIISSMNLYDSSKERNHELAYLFEGTRTAQEFKKLIVEDELLAASPGEHVPGWFHSVEAKRIESRRALESTFEEKGFCVSCGTKIELDQSTGKILQPKIIRCRVCWAKQPFIDNPFKYKIRFCHYCGQKLDSILDEPFHHQCRTLLKKYSTG